MKIKIWFTDFWETFNPYDNFFTRFLSEHYEIEVTQNNPEILFFSWVLKDFYNYKNCVRIYFTGENTRPDYTICDYSISFDYDSFDPRNIRLPLYVLYGQKEMLLKDKNIEQIALEKSKFCNFIYSNEKAKERKEFFDLLNKYKKVDSGGKVFNNIGYRVENKLDFIKDYKFTIAFENSSYRGYTTEKIFEPMMVKSIPIYWGNPNVKEDFNPKSFVNVHDYGSLKEVVDRVIELDSNHELYFNMFKEPYLDERKTDFFSEQRLLGFFEKVFAERVVNRNYPTNKDKNKVLISVVVPVYNTAEYLQECLESILRQNFYNFEVICVNDGSTDDSMKILEEYKIKYGNKIKILYQENQGLSAARNLGIENSEGKYLLFVDSDDKLKEGSLASLYNKAELMETDILGFNYMDFDGIIRPTKSLEYENGLLDGKIFFMLYYSANNDFPLSSSCLYLYRKSFLDTYSYRFKHGIYHEDEQFLLRLLVNCKKIYYYNEPFYIYRTDRDGSIMQNRGIKNARDLNLIAKELYYILKANEITERIFYRKIFQLFFTSAIILVDNNIRTNLLTEEDKYVFRSCIQNFSNYYYYSLISKDILLFKKCVIDKRPYLLSRIIKWSYMFSYFCFGKKHRMK